MAQILMLKRNCNRRQSREISCDVRAFQFAPLNLASGAAVMVVLQLFELFPYIYDIRRQFVNIIVEFLDCPFNR